MIEYKEIIERFRKMNIKSIFQSVSDLKKSSSTKILIIYTTEMNKFIFIFNFILFIKLILINILFR